MTTFSSKTSHTGTLRLQEYINRMTKSRARIFLKVNKNRPWNAWSPTLLYQYLVFKSLVNQYSQCKNFSFFITSNLILFIDQFHYKVWFILFSMQSFRSLFSRKINLRVGRAHYLLSLSKKCDSWLTMYLSMVGILLQAAQRRFT